MSEEAAVEDRAVSDATHGWTGQISEECIEEYSGGTSNILPQQKTSKQNLDMIDNSVLWFGKLLPS